MDTVSPVRRDSTHPPQPSVPLHPSPHDLRRERRPRLRRLHRQPKVRRFKRRRLLRPHFLNGSIVLGLLRPAKVRTFHGLRFLRRDFLRTTRDRRFLRCTRVRAFPGKEAQAPQPRDHPRHEPSQRPLSVDPNPQRLALHAKSRPENTPSPPQRSSQSSKRRCYSHTDGASTSSHSTGGPRSPTINSKCSTAPRRDCTFSGTCRWIPATRSFGESGLKIVESTSGQRAGLTRWPATAARCEGSLCR